MYMKLRMQCICTGAYLEMVLTYCLTTCYLLLATCYLLLTTYPDQDLIESLGVKAQYGADSEARPWEAAAMGQQVTHLHTHSVLT